MKHYRHVVGLIVAILCVPVFTNAQFGAAGFGLDFDQQLQINLAPLMPEPQESFTATADDYALGLPGSTMEWFVDGVLQSEFTNNRSVTLMAPNVGESMTLRLQITTPSNQTINTSRTILPLYTDIIVEPQTFAPFTYQGRPLPSFGSRVLLTALVHDQNGITDPALYSYTWTMNGQVVGGGVIRGGFRNTITIPHGRDVVIGINITDVRGNSVAQRLISIPSVPVDLHLYEVSPLFGLSNRVVGQTFPLFSNSTTLRAVPYNLDRFVDTDRLFTEWQIANQRQAVNQIDPFEITVTRAGIGSTPVVFKIRHRDALLQGGEARTTITY